MMLPGSNCEPLSADARSSCGAPAPDSWTPTSTLATASTLASMAMTFFTTGASLWRRLVSAARPFRSRVAGP